MFIADDGQDPVCSITGGSAARDRDRPAILVSLDAINESMCQKMTYTRSSAPQQPGAKTAPYGHAMPDYLGALIQGPIVLMSDDQTTVSAAARCHDKACPVAARVTIGLGSAAAGSWG